MSLVLTHSLLAVRHKETVIALKERHKKLDAPNAKKNSLEEP